MPYETAKSCNGCHRAFVGEGPYCPECKPEHDDIRRARDRNRGATDEYRKFLNSPAWRNLSATLRRENPYCQRIHADGKQCRWPSEAVHHKKDGRECSHRERLDPANLVALCRCCHNNLAGDLIGKQYVPTIYLGQEYLHS